MKKLFTISMALALGATAMAQETKVLFIGIDGLRSDALQQANTPAMDALIDEGLYTFDSWHLGVTSSGPSWSDMLTGVWEEKHGVTNNSYTGSNYNDYPYFVTRVKEYRPDLKAVQITSWGPMSDAVYNDGWDQKLIPPTDDACLQVAQIQLLDPELDLLFVHFDDCDAAGHGNGFSTDVAPYMNQIEYVDSQIGQLIASLEARPTYANEDWLVLLTTDHGGLGYSHGGLTDDERAIWWIARGGNVPNVEIFGEDPGSYIAGDANEELIPLTPVLTDIAVTAIDHLLPEVDPELEEEWDLDGKSWLDFATYIEKGEQADIDFTVWPNPSNGSFYIEITEDMASHANVRVLDMNGKVVKVIADNLASNTQKYVNLGDLEAGVYMLQVINNTQTSTRRIIIR